MLRAGVYRESFGTVTKKVTIQPYPHEQAWLSGSDVVTNWQPVANGWVDNGWTAQFCHTCYAAGAIDPNYPLAGWPDQVFFDGTPLTQVSDISLLAPGTFYVDYTNQALYVGSDPTVPSLVEATSRVQAGQFGAGASGSIVRGIGFMQYGPSWNENTPTGEIDDRGASNMQFENDLFTQSANRGLYVAGASNVTVDDDEFLSNGYTGFYPRTANNLDLVGNTFDNNNTYKFFDGFSSAAGAAGAKIAASYHVLVQDNIATNNYGNGIWNDVSSYDVDYIDNYARGERPQWPLHRDHRHLCRRVEPLDTERSSRPEDQRRYQRAHLQQHVREQRHLPGERARRRARQHECHADRDGHHVGHREQHVRQQHPRRTRDRIGWGRCSTPRTPRFRSFAMPRR